jgi:uncharacterized protein YbjT (DUF2867 family)
MMRRNGAASRLGPTSAEVVHADFDDAGSIRAALHGVRAAYLVTPSSPEAEGQQVRFAELAAEAGVEQLVKLSQFAAAEDPPVRFLRYRAAAEWHIRELGIDHTFLRPNLFFQGFLSFAALIAKEGRFFAPVGDARVSSVDARDIAAVAAACLTEPGHLGKTYTVTGPEAITHAEIGGAIAGATGREVAFAEIPPEAFAAALRGTGMPGWRVEGLVEDYAHDARGEASEVFPTVRSLTGREPRGVATFARDHAGTFVRQ